MLRKIIQVLIFQVITRYTERTEFGDCALPKPVTSGSKLAGYEPNWKKATLLGGFFSP